MVKKPTGKKLLAHLEKDIRDRGVQLAYEKLQFAGLRLNSGLCWFKGRYYLFVDRYKKLGERIELLRGALVELDRLAMEGRLDNPDQEAPPAEQAEEPGEASGDAQDQDESDEPDQSAQDREQAAHEPA